MRNNGNVRLHEVQWPWKEKQSALHPHSQSQFRLTTGRSDRGMGMGDWELGTKLTLQMQQRQATTFGVKVQHQLLFLEPFASASAFSCSMQGTESPRPNHLSDSLKSAVLNFSFSSHVSDMGHGPSFNKATRCRLGARWCEV